MEPYRDVVSSYTGFAAEAKDSPTFVEWALGVAGDAEVVEWISTLPPLKQQPNLVFAAARWHGVPAPGPYSGLREALLGDDGTIRATIMRRATQTNEVGRLATLLPVFSALETVHGPLALLEVGASAGLCLYPDLWSYRWRTDTGVHELFTEQFPDAAGVLPCRVKGEAPLPTRVPKVSWRGGLDLHPLDVTDSDEMAWLENLVWPEQTERRDRLAHAVALARTDPPTIRRGDLLSDLPDLVDEASQYGTPVVFHSAVLAYVHPDDRPKFEATMAELVARGRCHWVSNEGKQVLTGVTATGPEIPESLPTFVLGVNGRMVARTHGHGSTLRWTA
jgi:hypothetical protein